VPEPTACRGFGRDLASSVPARPRPSGSAAGRPRTPQGRPALRGSLRAGAVQPPGPSRRSCRSLTSRSTRRCCDTVGRDTSERKSMCGSHNGALAPGWVPRSTCQPDRASKRRWFFGVHWECRWWVGLGWWALQDR
jgi:hypothetical protein